MVDKILNKYRQRLMVLKENKANDIRIKDYPYDLDIQTTKEVISDIEKIKQHLTANISQ